MAYFHSPVTLGFGLLLTPLFSLADDTLASMLQRQDSKTTFNTSGWKMPRQTGKSVLDFGMQIKTEAFYLRNKNLRQGEKRENEMKWGPQVRLDSWIMKDSPVYGRVELEWLRKIKRKSGKEPDKNNHLELNQAYIGLTETIVPQTRVQLGRWLYRDEREWLFDENVDGALAQSKLGKWRIDALAGRINYWQRDLLDRASRNAKANNIAGLILRRKLSEDWLVAGYDIMQSTPDKGQNRQSNIGLRSYSQKKRDLQHWLELGMAESHKTRGFALDAGGTYSFSDTALKPRLTLGYAMGNKDYRQTGLQDNEATFGGETKFKFYGETLNPDLTNIQILTAGLGINMMPQATLDLVYHDYRQTRLTDLSQNRIDLKPKYDRQNSRRLGSGVNVILGWEPIDNAKIAARLGMFMPSKRFTSSEKWNSPRSDNAYSAGIEMAVKF